MSMVRSWFMEEEAREKEPEFDSEEASKFFYN